MSTLTWTFPKDTEYAIEHWMENNLRTPEGRLERSPEARALAKERILRALESDPEIAEWGGWDVALLRGKWLERREK